MSAADKIYLSIDQSSQGGLQLSIGVENQDGNGHGYRILGPKYNGRGKQLKRHYLTESDVQEISSYLERGGKAQP